MYPAASQTAEFKPRSFGERVNLHNNYIGQVERGEKNVTIDSLSKIAAGLEVSLEELFRHIDPMEGEDDLAQIHRLLAERPAADHTMALKVIQTVFGWAESQNK
ncbi:helix-turn-helix domain-containing protein [Saccharibacillus brassicae]|uniref:helix-turn-helix domain-containing protein n=1 Tax=Saccharibacillus brassicae TaxID=2583377 RepID=UPI001FECA53D|nr:helix-turn-helix transcriptional regulator [Saccharibacillus brassicae]